MNIDYLIKIVDLNLDSVPSVIRNEYEKQSFSFIIEWDGSYYSLNVFNNLKADYPLVINNKTPLENIKKFNENLSIALEEYILGFEKGFYDRSSLIVYSEEDKRKIAFQIFSGIHNKHNKIHNPELLRLKKNISIQNSLDFLQKNLYDYGYEVGCYIRDWTIIINNPNLFEFIFNKYYSNENIQEIAITKTPIFKIEIIDTVFEFLKDHFDTNEHGELKSILETGNDAPKKLYFKDNGNRIADAFKQLINVDYITGCQKKDLEKWIAKNFQYKNSKNCPTDFKIRYLQDIISTNKDNCKNPIFEIKKINGNYIITKV